MKINKTKVRDILDKLGNTDSFDAPGSSQYKDTVLPAYEFPL